MPELLPRIAIIARLDHPGGVQSVVLSLIKGLNSQGIQPTLVWDIPPEPSLLKAWDLQAGYAPVQFRIPSRLIDRLPITGQYISRVANTLTPRQVAGQYDFFFIFYNGFLVDGKVPHVRYLSGPPLLPQLDLASPGVRGVPFRLLRQLYKRFLRHLFPVYEYHRGSHYVINSQYTAQLFEEAHGVRLPVIHPPIDLSGRTFAANDLARRDTVTYFSRFVDYKRPEMVLKLAECYPQRRFVMMGGVKPQNRAYYAELIRQARAAGRENVFFFDNPSNTMVKEELARSRFFIFPAQNEHFGMATAEAIGSGAIPFVHDSGGQREIVPDERLRFTDDQFFNQFAALLQLTDRELNDIRFQLRRHVEQFSEETFTEKMLALAGINQNQHKDE